MAITRKPKPAASGPVDVEALISKGGSVARQEENRPPKSKETPVVVRIPSDLLDRIDTLVGTRQLKTPRHTWLLEALLEKANREEEEGKEL
jgi:hypothetical protein